MQSSSFRSAKLDYVYIRFEKNGAPKTSQQFRCNLAAL